MAIELTNNLILLIVAFIGAYTASYFILSQKGRNAGEAIKKGFLISVLVTVLILFILIIKV